MAADLREHPDADGDDVGAGAAGTGAGVASVIPGGALAVLLESLDLDAAGDGELVEVAAAWQRLGSWVHAQLARVAGVLSGRESMNPSWDPAAGHPPAQACVAGDELAMRLCVSRRAASRLVDHGRAFAGQLGATGQALAAGQITAVIAGRIADRLAEQPLQVALAVEDQVLPGAGRRTPAQIDRDLERALLVVDPQEAAARAVRARAGRCVFRPRVLGDGMASLTAVLPVVSAVRIDAALDSAARAARVAGDPRTLDQLRADGLRDLVLHTACTPDSDADAGVRAGAPDPQTSTGTPGTQPVDLSAGGATRTASAPIVAVTGPSGVDGPDRSATSPEARRGCPHVPRPRTEVHVTVALSTLLGMDDRPAELARGGSIDATTARALAAGGTWRRIVTDPASGTVLDVGRTTYRPPRALARHVRARDQVCARPGCPTPADSCDLDHTSEYHPADGREPGSTADTNLGPLCHRDHRLKTDGGFTLRQTRPGHYEWTTPAGHRYASTPGNNAHHQHLGHSGAPADAPPDVSSKAPPDVSSEAPPGRPPAAPPSGQPPAPPRPPRTGAPRSGPPPF